MTSFLHKLIARPAAPAPLAPATPAGPLSQRLLAHEEFIAEEDVTVERLLMLFRQAFVNVETAPGGERLVLLGESGLRMSLAVDAGRKLLHLQAAFGLEEAPPLHAKLEAANRLNEEVVFLRAAVVDDTTLTLDHQHAFDGGVSKAAIVGLVRRMDRIAPRALSQIFGEELLT
jgi:hypothetical protein